MRQLSKVQSQLRRAADARTLAYELESAAERRGDLVRRVVDFEAVEPARWRESTLVKTLLGAIRDEAVSLQQTEARVRGDLVVDSNLLVHRRMVVLTWILLGVALVTLALRFW